MKSLCCNEPIIYTANGVKECSKCHKPCIDGRR